MIDSRTLIARLRLTPQRGALAAILTGSALLNGVRLSQNGYANIYYSAAVKSMLRSLHNFVFVSADPSALIMVDKPPLGLWLQGASAELFGFSPLALLVPEAILGVLAVAALYRVVEPRFGAAAGLASAAGLAVFPSFVAISRDNNLDALLILLLILACGALLRAVETGRLRSLLASAALVGLAFETKSLAAFLVLPGLALGYLLCAPGALRRRLAALVAAGAVLAAVSCAWIAFIDLSTASQRPYVGGSTDNSALGLTLHYNGLGRVGGQSGGSSGQSVSIPAHGRLRSPITFGGPAGPLRLLDRALGDQGGWMLPFAFVGLAAIALTTTRRRDPRTAALFALGGWLLAEAAVLSFGSGIIHPYYVSALGPGVAAMAGAGAVALAALARRGGLSVVVPALAVLAGVLAQGVLLRREHFLAPWVPLLGLAAVLALVALVLRPQWAPKVTALTVATLLVAPAAYATTLWSAPVEGTLPAAGPHQTAGHGGIGPPPAGVRLDRALAAYVLSHGPGRRFAVLTGASTVAAPLILLDVRAAAVGGYGGTDPALDARGLARLISRGDARYVLLGGAYFSRGGNAATHAASIACRALAPGIWSGSPSAAGSTSAPVRAPSDSRLVLYDCAGRSAQIAATGARS